MLTGGNPWAVAWVVMGLANGSGQCVSIVAGCVLGLAWVVMCRL